MWRSIACLACCFGVAELTMPPGRKWQRQWSGLATDVDYTFKGQVRGAMDCSRVCLKHDSTKSYFYYDDTRECQCHDCTYSGVEDMLQTAPSAWYYEEVIELTEMTGIPCPCDASAVTNVIRSGASRFRIRAFVDTERTYDDAQAVCVSSGGILYKANTMERFNLAQQLMMQCPAYIPYGHFYVNGMYIVARDRYETSDGELIPMTQDFWAPERPNNWGMVYCLWMSAKFVEYRLDDRPRDIMSAYSTFAFCEIPQ